MGVVAIKEKVFMRRNGNSFVLRGEFAEGPFGEHGEPVSPH